MSTLFITVIVSFFASWLTFLSGFGLGTLLLPVFSLLAPLEVAVAMTALVHLANNFFKLAILKSHIHRPIFFRFGVPAVAGAIAGAVLLTKISGALPLYQYEFYEKAISVTPLKLMMGILIFVFAVVELSPFKLKAPQSHFYWSLGGALSGFFGGLSGHQGALRSMFLSQLHLHKEVFLGTGVAVACLIDIARLGVYAEAFTNSALSSHAGVLITGTLSAFIGSLVGKKTLSQISTDKFKWLVAICLMVFAIALAGGLV